MLCGAQVCAERVENLSHRQGAPPMEISCLPCGKQHCQTFTPEGDKISVKVDRPYQSSKLSRIPRGQGCLSSRMFPHASCLRVQSGDFPCVGF